MRSAVRMGIRRNVKPNPTFYSQASAFSDNFNRADAGDGTLGNGWLNPRPGTPLGSGADGGPWTTQGVNANSAQASAGTNNQYRAMFATHNVGGNNFDYTVTLSIAQDQAAGILFRSNAGFTQWYDFTLSSYNPSGLNCSKVYPGGGGGIAGLATTVRTNTLSSLHPGNGSHTVRVRCANTTVQLWLDSTLVFDGDIPASDAAGYPETLCTYIGLRQDRGSSGGGAPSAGTYPGNYADDINVVAS